MEAAIGARVRARLKEVLPDLTQAEFAARVDIPADAFSRSLNGKRAFTAVELVDIARELGSSAHWFVTGESDPFAVRYAGRHSFDHSTKSHVPIDWDEADRALADVALAYIQAYGDEPALAARAIPVKPDVVRATLAEAGGEDFVRRLADLVESELGVDVVRIPGVDRGYALDVLGHRVIVVGETGSWFYENWSIAHELAHVAADELSPLGDSACDDPEAERRANRFASTLLLPDDVMRAVPWATATEADLGRFLWDTGVSTKAVAHRLQRLGIVPSSRIAAALELKTQAVISKSFVSVPGNEDRIASRMQDASARRFPAHLIAKHRIGVAEGSLLPEMLAWMLSVDPSVIEWEIGPSPLRADIAWLGKELGLDVPGD